MRYSHWCKAETRRVPPPAWVENNHRFWCFANLSGSFLVNVKFSIWWFFVASGTFFWSFSSSWSPWAPGGVLKYRFWGLSKNRGFGHFFLPCLTILVHALRWEVAKIWSPYCACGFLFSWTAIKNYSGENELSNILKPWNFDPCYLTNVIFQKI